MGTDQSWNMDHSTCWNCGLEIYRYISAPSRWYHKDTREQMCSQVRIATPGPENATEWRAKL